jgi:hypothetical protein
MGAPERYHAKWLMFACMTCIIMGPALNVASSIAGVKRGPNFLRANGPGIEVSEFGGLMILASSVISLGSMVFFLLFLRAAARCFENSSLVTMAELLLGFNLLLVVGVLFLRFNSPQILLRIEVLSVLCGASLLCLVWFLVLIVKVRALINESLSQIKSPLDMQDFTPPQLY